MPLLRRLPIPSDRFGIVFAHASSFFIHLAQIVLGIGMPLLRRLPIPSDRFGIVLAHAASDNIHQAQVNQGGGKPFDCLFHGFTPVSV